MEPQPVTDQPSISPVAPTTKPKNRIVFFIGGILILGLGFTIGLLFNKNLSPTSQTSLAPTPSPIAIIDPTANWKTYSNEQFGFTIRYPAEWQVQESHNPIKQAPYYGSKTSDSVKFFSDTGYIQFFTGVEFETSYPTQQQIRVEPMTLSGKNLEKEIYSASGQKTETIKFVIKIPNSTPFRIDALFQAAYSDIVDQILSTFKFIDQSSDPEGRFCRGIYGVICPDGYGCKYDNHYPDASGECIKGFESGTLVAKVVRSPTCAGPVTGQENCEGPYVNGTFKIMRLPGNEDIQTITTDKDGTFSTSLNPGVYNLQNTESGIGKNIRNPSFTIAGGKSTIQRFDIDTGIR